MVPARSWLTSRSPRAFLASAVVVLAVGVLLMAFVSVHVGFPLLGLSVAQFLVAGFKSAFNNTGHP